MLAQQVAKKYSGALLELAQEHNILDRAWTEFKAIGEFLKKDRTFLDFMSAPQVPGEAKDRLITKVFSTRLEKPLFNFILFLARKRRISFLPDIIVEFDRLVKAEKGIIRATCITTAKIPEAERQRLIEKLTKKTSLKVELDEKIDKSIIGGMIVILHNKIIDGSLRHGLDQLKNRLMKVRVH
jgi:ATP synthase F1 delta subunit